MLKIEEKWYKRSVHAQSSQGKVCFGEHCFYVELATSSEQHALGLMFRKNLDLDRGMLFIFQEEKEHSFWMKNMSIALDIIWINNDKEVVFIEKEAQPCDKYTCKVINPREKALYVLEINAGISEEIKLKPGDRLELSIN